MVDDQIVDHIYEGRSVAFEKEEGKFGSNQFLMLVSNANEKKTALVRFKNYGSPLHKVSEYKNGVWGLKPRNKEQMLTISFQWS